MRYPNPVVSILGYQRLLGRVVDRAERSLEESHDSCTKDGPGRLPAITQGCLSMVIESGQPVPCDTLQQSGCVHDQAIVTSLSRYTF